ncbi:divisome protein SepX/GlpR [Amycolatopsis taiwanensis]|uniref:Uncharacterized protein n=1 Tax=Amycolatopsis taiwanensis TaxID=342230 RepID=A0A9W6VEV4_9PSEU|nr:gephyrin-like molybdotransferase receptor GlpR [Amycolatopsis taiwanensis]GLY64209.1 hypothetical protein Atai01_08280 [Amycolatopsis taiwanensis]
MPSSLIIVALAAAWLAVLVPMVVRKRQAVARTADTELAARVVRSAEDEFPVGEDEDVAEPDEPLADEPAPSRSEPPSARPPSRPEPASERRYRPGRGGFDPEAAEIAARAKYAFRQRVVLSLIILAVLTAVGAGVLFTKLWWAHGAIDLVLVSYLGYLRRQVRIENEIRQRRLARFNTRARGPVAHPIDEEYTEPEADDGWREPIGVERAPAPVRETAVVVDVDDEDPEFHELDDPGQLPFRRAVGE